MKTLGKLGLFAGGVLFGTAGIKILSSKDAKKIKENAGDILADAKKINDDRNADGEVIEDASEVGEAEEK